MNIDQYLPLPPKVRSEKLLTLLAKKENKHKAIANVYAEVFSFLENNNLTPMEFSIPDKPPIRALQVEKTLLFVVEDYSLFNTAFLPKKYIENLHFKMTNDGFRVIWVKKFEWEDLRKRNVLQSLILHSVGKTKNRIFARNTYAEVIPSKDLKVFFNDSSFYGYRNASFAVCLRDKKTKEILMAMNFGHPYYGKNKYGGKAVECIRAASKAHTVIVGGMSKLMRYMIEQFGSTFDTIVYYVDDAHYSSKSMSSIGFNYSHFAGGASHNVWKETGSMFMRTPALHQEIMFMIKKNEILAIPDVGNSTFVYKT